MKVLRIVPDIGADKVEAAQAFYGDFLGMEEVMNQGWIATYAGVGPQWPQVSIMTEGGAGAPAPDMSIEVNDIDEAHRRAIALGVEITYPLTDEPWGVRRFFARDPFGRLVNILAHQNKG